MRCRQGSVHQIVRTRKKKQISGLTEVEYRISELCRSCLRTKGFALEIECQMSKGGDVTHLYMPCRCRHRRLKVTFGSIHDRQSLAARRPLRPQRPPPRRSQLARRHTHFLSLAPHLPQQHRTLHLHPLADTVRQPCSRANGPQEHPLKGASSQRQGSLSGSVQRRKEVKGPAQSNQGRPRPLPSLY